MKITHRFGRIREIAGGAALAMLAGIMFAIVGSLAVAPAAHAQIVPASLTHEAVPDSKQRRAAPASAHRAAESRGGQAQAAILRDERGSLRRGRTGHARNRVLFVTIS